MNSKQNSIYDNKSGYIPGEFSDPVYQYSQRLLDEDYIYVPFWETDDNFMSAK